MSLLLPLALLFGFVLGVYLLPAWADHELPAEPSPENPRAADLAESAFGLVEAQVRAATTQDGTIWASQPGAIRTFREDGRLSRLYKLYSAADLLAASAGEAAADLPADWDQYPARFVDLNAPVLSGGELEFPIADPRSEAEGFFFRDTINGVVLLRGGPDDVEVRLPMPVQWVYLLQDGTRGFLDARNRFIGPALATAENPIVGRIAFWADDNSAKINLNTASEGVFWDIPRTDTVEDRGLANSQPAAGEYQRHPGHPATVCLSSVLFPHRRLGTPEGGSGRMGALTRDEAELLWWIGNGTGLGGSVAGTVPLAELQAARPYPADYTPYTSIDEIFERRREAGFEGDSHELKARVGRSGFFLTTESNAPELNLRGYPRVSVWPRDDSRNPPEVDFNGIASPGGHFFGISRRSASSRHYEYYSIDRGRNQTLFAFLNLQASLPIPGFGGRLSDKYGSGAFSDREQILAMVFDHVRSTNLDEPGPSAFSPSGQVTSLCLCGGTSPHNLRWDRPEFPDAYAGGRIHTVSEVALVFHCSGWRDGFGNSGGDVTGLDAGQKRIAVGLVVETFCPAQGFAFITPELGVRLSGATGGGVTASPPPRMAIDDQPIGMLSGSAAFLATESGAGSIGTPGGHGGADLVLRGADGGGITWDGGVIVDIAAETMRFEGNTDELQLILYDTDEVGLANRNNAVQVLKLKFPDARIPTPAIPANAVSWETRLRQVRASGEPLITDSDVVRSLVVGHGDYRLVAATRATLEEDFQPHFYYSNPVVRYAHSLLMADGSLARGATFQRELVPRSNVPESLAADTPLSPAEPSYAPRKRRDYSFPVDPAVTGDFDNGFGNTRDGAYLNRPDDGVLVSASGASHYFDRGPGLAQVDGRVIFAPHRMMPGPAMFGSIPTGVRAGIPWRTLLFRPDSQHFGASATPDHLWLDLFRMPAPLPYRNGRSRPGQRDWKGDALSSDGKINLNYQILPFTHIHRATAVHAALKAEKLMAIPSDHGAVYKSPGGPESYRHFIDAEQTLSQWEAMFSRGEIFRSATQICEMYLVPEGRSLGPRSGDDYPVMRQFWEDHQLTGDNTKERPYAALYQHFTTQSNSYRVHVIAQTLVKSPGVPAGVFDLEQDRVGEEYRGVGTLTRRVDPDRVDPPGPLASSLAGRYEYALNGVRPPLGGRFEITAIRLGTGGDPTVTWLSNPGESYTVQRSTDLRSWSDRASVPAAPGTTTTFADATAPAGVARLFYRIVR